MTYREAIVSGEKSLCEAGIADARNDAWLLLTMACKIDHTYYYMHIDEEMPEELQHEFEVLIKKRAERVPLQYITGEQEFMGMTFHVNSNVLIPRQDTETLVEEALKVVKPGMKVLDMCTGSGCIPISLKLRNPQIVIEGADISEEALKVAEKNAKKLGVSGKWIQTDMFENITGTFDMITSNPPYIQTKVIEELEAEVRLHDPYEALDGKEDGLYFYRILAEKVPEYLTDGGWLVMEIGYDQSADVEKLLKETGFEQVSTQKDLAGLDRVVCGVYNRRSK